MNTLLSVKGINWRHVAATISTLALILLVSIFLYSRHSTSKNKNQDKNRVDDSRSDNGNRVDDSRSGDADKSKSNTKPPPQKEKSLENVSSRLERDSRASNASSFKVESIEAEPPVETTEGHLSVSQLVT